MSFNTYERSSVPLDLSLYAHVEPLPIALTAWFDTPICPYPEQRILRMPLALFGSTLKIPKELQWLKPWIVKAKDHQHKLLHPHPFCYVTVRHGVANTVGDDLWHVDGYSDRCRHLPEQNYIWTSDNGTDYWSRNVTVPLDFDPMKHNLHWFFQDTIKFSDPDYIVNYRPETWLLVDPYVIHRRNAERTMTGLRTFIRISFCPIEIMEDNYTTNPLIPRITYGRKDIREVLTSYKH